MANAVSMMNIPAPGENVSSKDIFGRGNTASDSCSEFSAPEQRQNSDLFNFNNKPSSSVGHGDPLRKSAFFSGAPSSEDIASSKQGISLRVEDAPLPARNVSNGSRKSSQGPQQLLPGSNQAVQINMAQVPQVQEPANVNSEESVDAVEEESKQKQKSCEAALQESENN